MGKVNGVPVFTALHTVVNEYSEIRSMVMTPTKAHSQYMPAIREVSKSLATYGHEPIQLVFTDAPWIDKQVLEINVPSLLNDIVPVPNHSVLDPLTIPVSSTVVILSSTFQVNTRLNSIMSKIRHDEDFFVAFDMEWSVNRDTGIHGRVALISLTYGKEIFIIPVCVYPDNSLKFILITSLIVSLVLIFKMATLVYQAVSSRCSMHHESERLVFKSLLT